MSTVVCIKGDANHLMNVKDWCLDTFGIDCRELMFGKWYYHGPGRSDSGPSFWMYVRGSYIFRDEADAVLFKLRWA